MLLLKTKFYGISGVTNKLMESYLRYRYQRVVKMLIIIRMVIFSYGEKYNMESHRVQFFDHYCF